MGRLSKIKWVKIKNNTGGFRLVKSGKSVYKKIIPKLRYKESYVNRKSKRSQISTSIK